MSSAAPAPTPRVGTGAAAAGPRPTPVPPLTPAPVPAPDDERGWRCPSTLATLVSCGTVVVVVAVQLAVPGGWGSAAWVVLVAGLLLGLPHGAVDHLVPAFLLAERAPRLLLVLAGYVTVAVTAWLAFRAVPAVALVVFVAVSAWHFGTGEVTFDEERAGRAAGHRDLLAVLAAGGSVLLLPVVSDPTSVAPVIALLVPGSTGTLPRWLVVGVLTVVLAAAVVTVVRRVRRRRWLSAAEVVLLAALGLLVPPLAAFGTYFGAWHGVRHVARLVEQDPANAADLARSRVLRPLRRFALVAAAPTAVALAAVLALWSLADGWRGFVTANLSLLAGLTVPHVLVVAWWDRQRSRSPHDLT